tara:strand:+ start:365 stop:544 length:180 start_codon:yes stop_codon:yes gene_type:complete
MINKSIDNPILTLSALTTLFLLPLSFTKKNNELNKLIIISTNKNKNIVLNIINFLIYET